MLNYFVLTFFAGLPFTPDFTALGDEPIVLAFGFFRVRSFLNTGIDCHRLSLFINLILPNYQNAVKSYEVHANCAFCHQACQDIHFSPKHLNGKAPEISSYSKHQLSLAVLEQIQTFQDDQSKIAK
jgi:hypothetical protein